jgi:DNA-binding protein
MELWQNEFRVFVGAVEPFADDIIRNLYVLPAIDLLNQDKVDTIVFKAKGQAINVAVRAALLLQNVVGVMQKAISISSDTGRSKSENAGDEGRPRRISTMEISLKRF